MNKVTAIILLVILALFLFLLIRVLLPSIKIYLARMPKGIFVLLFLAVIATMAYLVYFLFTDRTGGNPGNEADGNVQAESTEKENEKPPKENCIVLSGDDILIENKKADSVKLNQYIDYRVENNIEITIVDNYASAAMIRDIKAVCDQKGVRYIIKNETWLE